MTLYSLKIGTIINAHFKFPNVFCMPGAQRLQQIAQAVSIVFDPSASYEQRYAYLVRIEKSRIEKKKNWG